MSDYDRKAQFLKDRGWETLWSDDNWVKTGWYETIANIDWAGLCTHKAYEKALGELLQEATDV